MQQVISAQDEKYMQQAILIAKKGLGLVNPNPMVGALIVKNNKLIGQGYHQAYGGLHAERNALLNASESPRGATLYVTLEPCCHHGKTPPCTQAILEAGIQKVVIGTTDPNTLVNGRGKAILTQNGVEVVSNVLAQKCQELNEVFFHFTKTQKPFVVMKYAMSLDGKIATANGDSRWISNEKSRRYVQKLRKQYSAIMVGAGTIISDNPQLTKRIPGGNNPLRIICDSQLRIPLSANVVKTAQNFPTLIATTSPHNCPKSLALQKAGCQVVSLPHQHGKVDLQALTNYLGEKNIDSVLLEGGGTLNESALKQGIVNKALVFIAPKLIGGQASKTPVEGLGVSEISQAYPLKRKRIRHFGEDILLEMEVIQCSQESSKN